MDIQKLNTLYTAADSADSELFAEQRSNILLTIGDHYTKKASKFWQRVRDSKELSNEQKIRLIKNHISKVVKTYVNNITSQSPGVVIGPKNESELQDVKAAELHGAAWEHIKKRHKIRRKAREYAEDFVQIGEGFCKVFWDPMAGDFVGYEAEMDPMTGQPLVGPDGQMVASKKPVFTGDLSFERIFGFNVLRAPEAKSMEESRFLIIRKMVERQDLEAMVGQDETKLQMLKDSVDETYTIFDANNGTYRQEEKQVMVREYYFRPCVEYPNGYFYITTKSGILFEGELPLGIFPIIYIGFDEVPTSPRARSIIKQLRPYQVEVNRAASKIAEHQVSLSDDKLLIQSGTRVANGGLLPGVRAIQYSGMAPSILPGRSGEQYLAYMQSQIEEMYRVANVVEDSDEKLTNLDPYTMLFRSLRDKKRFSHYTDKFEEFLVELCEISLRLYKAYCPENVIIPAIGRKEAINIAEFKSADDLSFQIKVEPMEDDVSTMMGKQLTFNHTLQYVGQSLGKDDIGKILRQMPFANSEGAFDDLVIDYDNATNDILALDRGEYPPINEYDSHPYMIKRLTKRTRESDFKTLHPQIQMLYQRRIAEHQKLEAENIRKKLAAQADFIPVDGYLVVMDYYVPDPRDPAKTQRVRLPANSIKWLIQRMQDQGNALSEIEQLSGGAQAQIAQSYMGQASIPPGMSGQQSDPAPVSRVPSQLVMGLGG